ncbi:glycerol-3-phosphate 1-O-acyltransferase PlsY [Arenimonas sp.]|uniref:glycerol-3-phosphate 1-O-acyltransferase PlsY n=1 Tax=Arenimonas sp. TaxID=1872635 RepID=UPI0039E700E6
MTSVLILLLAAYLLGSVSGSLLLGRLRGVDIRTQGSGNAGGTNALRTQGWKFALGTVIVDVGKGVLAAWLALRFGRDFAWSPYAAVLAAICGHVWPVFHGFRGGKGAGTLIGGLLLLWPWALLPVLAVWILSLGLGGYVGLSTVLAVATLPVFALVPPVDAIRLLFGFAVSLLIVFTHRANLARLRAGTEHRFERARFLRRRRSA